MRTVPAALPRPPVPTPAPFVFPTPRTARLSTGLQVTAYDLPGQYVHSLRLAVPMPVRVEPEGLEGVGTMMARMLDEGTERWTSSQFARLMERRGVAIGAGMGESGLTVEVDVAKDNLDNALDLLRQVLVDPVFPQGELERHVRQRLAEIDQDRSIPAQRAALEFASTFYAAGTRAAIPTGGSADSVASITRADLRDLHAAHVAPTGATLVIAGDFAELDVFATLAQALDGWSARPAYRSPPAWELAPLASDRARIVVVDRPESVQTEIVVGCPGPDRHVAGGWAPYPVLGFLVGGSPTARLDAVLREEKGYTYGIRSAFRPRRRGGLFLTSGSVRGDVTVESVALILDLLDGAREGFTAEEARTGADYISLTAPGRYATADTIADEALSLAFDGLTTQFTTDMLAEISAIDSARLDAAYRDTVDRAWTVVLVGDAARFVDGVRGLDRGEVAVVAN